MRTDNNSFAVEGNSFTTGRIELTNISSKFPERNLKRTKFCRKKKPKGELMRRWRKAKHLS